MYLMGVILLMGLVESMDPDKPNASLWFALSWPYITLLYIFDSIIYGPEGDE